MTQTRRRLQILWTSIFLIIIGAPLLIMVLAPQPQGRQFWRDAAVALGFVGLAMVGLQFIPTTRMGILAEVYDLDTIYIVHHDVSNIGFLLVLLHPIILILDNPYTFVAFNVLGAPFRLVAGVIGLLGLVLIALTSNWRQWLKIPYERWRLLHDLFAITITGFAIYHILEVDYYTSQPLQRGLWILYAAVWAGMVLYVRVIKPWRLMQHPWEVVDLIEERGKTWSLVLEPQDHHGMPFKAGQVAWLTVNHSPFLIEEHPFSITSSAERPDRLEFAIRELGDFTNRISQVPIGAPVYIDGPYGTFDMAHHPGSQYVFIAGGIGSAPIMSMLRTMADRGDDREVHFFYGNRTWESATFREELAELEEKLNLEVIHVLEQPPEGWEGETGYITPDVLRRHMPTNGEGCVYFICGPLPLINLVKPELVDLEVDPHRIYTEQYEMA